MIDAVCATKTPAAGGGIPATVTSGQFRWSIIQSRGETKLNGRAEIVSVANGITSSYSCPECCPWSHAGAWLNPSGLSAPVNTTSDTIVTEGFSDCFGNFQGTYAAWAESWTVVNSSITSMSTVDWGLGRANGLSEGLTDVDGRWLSELLGLGFHRRDLLQRVHHRHRARSGGSEGPELSAGRR